MIKNYICRSIIEAVCIDLTRLRVAGSEERV